ncbi:LAQU0S03e02938g1_1 [Lachancea quebecensis]|uniref:LAQU0S03e02938g1_1 n=1 Tax=Lachancea quebecensis TaxID=1654605 RepID=A0A0P1KNK1_9SACH|nr:LAQU0S03e02938g1_1 [Lachancea quebecensis]
MEDKYIGLVLAITSSLAIGSSFILTKMGLNAASESNNNEGAGYEYLKNPIWWGGMATMAVGEIANFAAYTFAPAIMVTPLGALSVIIGAVLAAIFLKEELGTLGKLGCAICLLGSVIIILHAPSDKDIETVDEILGYAMQPAFILYALLVTAFAVFMISKVVPVYGTKNPMVYISICSTVGSISVMAIKAFGIALKLTLSGNNQFTHLSTYVFIIVVVVCIMTQMNYFNKALDQFDTSIVNPLYYVTFTTATLTASFILFRNFDESNTKDSMSLVCGFLIIFSGVYLLNLARKKNHSRLFSHQQDVENIPLDNNIGGFVRKSFQGTHHRVASQTYQSEEMVHLTGEDEDVERFRV